MTNEQLEQAKKRATELLKYQSKTQQINDFINLLEMHKILCLYVSYEKEMWSDYGETYELIGEELIELLKKKLWEREDYLEKLVSDDLIT